MKTGIVILFFLTLSKVVSAQSPDTSKQIPTTTVCRADLKAWSAQKTDTLSIAEINARMTEMYTCAEQAKTHEKKMRAYLDEFYRTHAELANRTFDFITRHNLQEQFGEEENGTVAEAKPEPK